MTREKVDLYVSQQELIKEAGLLWLNLEVYVPDLRKRKGEAKAPREKQVNFFKTNRFLEEQRWAKKLCDNVSVAEASSLSLFLLAMTLRLGLFLISFLRVDSSWKGDFWKPHFHEVSSFSQIREDPKRLLSASIDSQMSSA